MKNTFELIECWWFVTYWDSLFAKNISMKVTFPKNIKKWFLSGFTLNIGPFNISVLQLLMVAMGVGLAMVAFNAWQKAWSKAAWIFFAILILILVGFVTFFKVSEMNIVQLVAKKIKENFFDVTKKYQSNSEKLDPVKISLKEWEIQEVKQQVVEQKQEPEVDEIIKNIKDTELV